MSRLFAYTMIFMLSVFSLAIFVFFQRTKAQIDTYANHATSAGLPVSIIGFLLTFLAVRESIRVNKATQVSIQIEVAKKIGNFSPGFAQNLFRISAFTPHF